MRWTSRRDEEPFPSALHINSSSTERNVGPFSGPPICDAAPVVLVEPEIHMSAKVVHFRGEAREKVMKGVTALADAVRVTLGPRSRCVLIERKWGAPIVCNDGVTIAKE